MKKSARYATTARSQTQQKISRQAKVPQLATNRMYRLISMIVCIPVAVAVVFVSGCASNSSSEAGKPTAPSASPLTRSLERKSDMEEQRKDALRSAQHLADEEKQKSK